MIDKVISVIVPIYNAENYLEECLVSICNQSYEQLQIILINDGSTDSSLAIAKRFADNDPRIILIDQSNAGVAAARQAGLHRVTGEYIIHCDADDLVPHDAYENLMASVRSSNAEIAVGNYIVRFPGKDVSVIYDHVDTLELLRLILSGVSHGSLWNKLIRSDLYHGLCFEKGMDFMEDKLVLVQILAKENVELSFVSSPVYIYRQVPNSYTNTMSERSVLISTEVEKKICDLMSDRFDEVFLAHVKNKRRISSLLNSNVRQKNNFPEANQFLLSDQEIPFHHKIVLWCEIKGIRAAVSIYKFVQVLLGRRN